MAVMSSRWREAEKRAERAVVAQQEVREHTQREHTHNFNTQFRCGCGASIADVVALYSVVAPGFGRFSGSARGAAAETL